MQQDYGQFLELIRPQPGYKMLDITSHADALTRAVAQRLLEFEGSRLAIALYPGEHEEFTASKSLKMHSPKDYSAPFKALPRDNDVVMIRDVLSRHAYPERIVKAIYTTLANAGDIIIVNRAGSMDIQEQLELLEACEFRAGNSIDILDGYELVMGKKMHMWGNGL
jgi:hypothetical protein